MQRVVDRAIPALIMLAITACFWLSGVAPATGSTPAPRAGWKTFISKSLHIALDYPSVWRVTESTTGAVFTSPRGITIQLGVVDTGVLSPEEFQLERQLPNTRCTSSKNGHGLIVRSCLDTVSFSYSADFVVRSAQGPSKLLSLSMSKRGDAEVLKGMIASLRPVR